jgi:ATP-dependent DNA helicase RecQ
MLTFPYQVFQLWIAPPAWGKTRLIRELVQSSPYEFLFISPLRALAIEVKKQCSVLNTVLPEEISNYDWQALAYAKPDLIVIWDEIHLMKEWGESFRPAYLEAWYGFCLSGLRGIGMSATLNGNVKDFLIETLSQNYEFILMGDAGNFSLHNKQIKYFLGPLDWRNELLENYCEQTIVFCSHRYEVDLWEKKLNLSGINAWGCKGGETKQFQERLTREPAPQIIIATSCLSHGVNLPNLKRVILFDDQAPWWMLHQMQTRAGRRGGTFEVWGGLRHPNLTLVDRIVAFLRLSLRVMICRVKSTMKAWLYGVRGISHSSYSAKRA